jgi:hypothetical protein
VAADPFDRGGGLLGRRLIVVVGDRHAGALAPEGDGDGSADSTGGAGDHDNPIL